MGQAFYPALLWPGPNQLPLVRDRVSDYQGVGGIGLVVFRQGVGGIGLVVLAANQGVGGIGLVVFASVEWVVKAFKPIALVSTNSTSKATVNHLFIDPPKGNYGVESIGGTLPSRGKFMGVCPNGTHPSLRLALPDLSNCLGQLSRGECSGQCYEGTTILDRINLALPHLHAF